MIVECFARRLMMPFQGVLQVIRAGALARLFRLYPKTLDERLIRVARVQARMQGSHEAAAHYEEPFLWAE